MVVGGTRSMWIRFLADFPSGTIRNRRSRSVPEGSRIATPVSSASYSSNPSAAHQKPASSFGSRQSNVSVPMREAATGLAGGHRGAGVLEDPQPGRGLLAVDEQRRRHPDRRVAGTKGKDAVLEALDLHGVGGLR